MDYIGDVLFLFGLFVLYFVPTIVVLRRDHPRAAAIFVLNLLLGWTVLGWIIAFLWSLRPEEAMKYCTNCGMVKTPERITPGSLLIEVMLWLVFILPGLIYSVWRRSARYYGCPVCGHAEMIPLDSPRAMALRKAAERELSA